MNKLADVAIIGAGPYGLSIAAHLRAYNVPFRIFGSPMRFWKDMVPGTALKSPDFATNIYVPQPGYTFVEYCRDRGISSEEPISMSYFAEYGEWVQKRLVPEVEAEEVTNLEENGGTYTLTLSSGEQFSVRGVVIAVGVRYFAKLPEVLTCLPGGLVRHTSELIDYSALRGKRVTVVGAGQSAIEAAKYSFEGGASVRMVVRGNGVWFASKPEGKRSLKHRILYPESVMGPGRENWVLQHFPLLAHYISDSKRVSFTRKHLGPFGTWWNRDVIEENVEKVLNTEIVGARVEGSHVVLTERGPGSQYEVEADVVLAGTGFEPDLRRIPFLERGLADRLQVLERAPRLSSHFESSSPGLYFVGPVSAFSFGPLERFVCGAALAAPRVARHLASRLGRRGSLQGSSPELEAQVNRP